MPRFRQARVLLLLLLTAGPAAAQGGAAAQRFPQPVEAGQLVGRQVLRPVEQQDVLGRVAAVVRGAGDTTLLVVRTGGVLGFGTRTVAVPLAAAALLGEHVALLDVSPDQLRALPDFTPAGTMPLPPGEVVRVGLTRPFH